MKTAIKALLFLVFLVVIGCGATIASGIYSNGFESTKSRYLITAGGVVGTKAGITFGDEGVKVGLKGAGFKAADWGDYNVAISFNPAAAIVCTSSDGEIKPDSDDVTAAFTILRGEYGFEIAAGDYRAEKVVQTVYGAGTRITQMNITVAPYILTVTDGGGKSVSCPLLNNIEGTDIKPYPGAIVAG